MKTLAVIIAALALSGCVSAADVVKALAQDKASACIKITVAFPPFANTAEGCRSNSDAVTATIQNGSPSIVPVKP